MKFSRLRGPPPSGAARLKLGRQEIELVQFNRPGSVYPRPHAANDPWFQHFAIVVSDMDKAHKRLCLQPHERISIGGPAATAAEHRLRDRLQIP